MDKDYFLNDDGSFVIKNYNEKFPFSNFLPGIAGLWGIPFWAFYVNRAQGIISFGIKDKNHSLMEFFPARKAYWLVASCGFRTFLKINNEVCYEPFRIVCAYKREEKMVISSASLEIVEVNYSLGLEISVKYFTLPNSPLGGLVRVLRVKNISPRRLNLDIVDGTPRIIPFGAKNTFLKDLATTLEAWMHSFIFSRYASFRLIVDPKDVSHTQYIEGANFATAFYEDKGKTLYPHFIVDPDTVFGKDKSYSLPLRFFQRGFKPPLSQITCGKMPCSFSYFKSRLKPQEAKTLYGVFGASFKANLMEKFISRLNPQIIREKERENEEIIEKIKQNALCLSARKEFNHYLSATYLDNVLRGGYPYRFDGRHIYYVFSRKHGDLERDYNKFKLLPSSFSEGEANYRDINQNRRMDLFFNPFIEKKNIIYFLNLMKIDGYNPLVVKGEKLFFRKKDALAILGEFKLSDRNLLLLMERGFYLGEFFNFLEDSGCSIKIKDKEKLAKELLACSMKEPAASFREGYWIDHWRYNLDLIENFLYFYPDRRRDLFLSREYFFWDDEARVRKRKFRYYLRGGRVYQGESVEKSALKQKIINKRKRFKNILRTRPGTLYRTNLIEKLLSIILNKLATLDPEGVGVEMEADKPGWCDSLNGLPALFGSSLCETLELKRACAILLSGLSRLREAGITHTYLCGEVFSFFNRLSTLLKNYSSHPKRSRDLLWWDKANAIKEDFRRQAFLCLKGRQKKVSIEKLEKFLQKSRDKLTAGIEKAQDKASRLYFTYFTYTVKKYRLKGRCVFPQQFQRQALPLFLEGAVHILRTEEKKEIYYYLKKSPLFDKKLKMYRLNTSLAKQPLEIGRSRVFVPGWLENESIWLHMEYKYLLEVLRNGLYKEFFRDFYKACVCFFKPHLYGRSILENSSFIVSSAYPDEKLWGRGFIARLSGATAELLNIWIILCLGREPFSLDKNNQLCFKFSPILEGKMFTTKEERLAFKGREVILEKNTFTFKLFSSTLVVYHNPKRKDTFGNCRVKTVVLHREGEERIINSFLIKPPLSFHIRQAKIDRIDVYLE